MVGPVHHEFGAFADLAKLTDDELVANKVVMVRDLGFEVVPGVIGEISDDDIGVPDGRFDVNKTLVIAHREDAIRIRGGDFLDFLVELVDFFGGDIEIFARVKHVLANQNEQLLIAHVGLACLNFGNHRFLLVADGFSKLLLVHALRFPKRFYFPA